MTEDKIHTMVSNAVDKMLDSPEGQQHQINLANATKKTILFIRNEIENTLPPANIDWDKLMRDAYQLLGIEIMRSNFVINIDIETQKKKELKKKYN